MRRQRRGVVSPRRVPNVHQARGGGPLLPSPVFAQDPPPVTPSDVDTKLAKLGASPLGDDHDPGWQDPTGGAIGIAQPEQQRDTDTKAVEPQGPYNGLDYLVPFPGDPDDD